MVRGLVGAVVVSFAAWVVMRYAGVAGPDVGLYGSLLRQAWEGLVRVLAWLAGSAAYPQRAVLVVAAVVGFMLGAKSGK